VYLSAIEGHVPEDMVRTFSAYLDFCYLVRRPVIDEDNLKEIHNALARFYQYHPIFQETGVREPGPKGFSLPRQHSISHYPGFITNFAAPNGLCSSITENLHIRAVKKPWRRSGRNEALGQMLLTNQWLDKLAACRVDFCQRKMLAGSCLMDALLQLSPMSQDDRDSGDDERSNDEMDVDETMDQSAGVNNRYTGDDDDDWGGENDVDDGGG
jgi:hypothetical protein